MDKTLKASLDWINSIAAPNSGFGHPNDENKVKCAARALDKMGIHIDNHEVIDYCLRLGMPQNSIDKIVEWFGKQKNLRLKNAMKFSVKELKEIWSRIENQE